MVYISDVYLYNFVIQMQYGITANQLGHAGEVEETPLAHACARGFLEIVKVLIEKGANVNFLCSVCHYIVLMHTMLIMVCLFPGYCTTTWLCNYPE